MKKIIIIEDRFKEFERIKNVIDDAFCCPQQYTNDDFNTSVKDNFINKLKTSLKVTCETSEEYDEQKNVMRQLQNELKNYCDVDDEPIYLIDYNLDGGGAVNEINGIRFKNKFLKEMYPDKIIPVLFITNTNYTSKIEIEDYVKKINNNTICAYQTKPNSNDWNRVRDSIVNFISNAQLQPRIDEHGRQNIEDIYEGN